MNKSVPTSPTARPANRSGGLGRWVNAVEWSFVVMFALLLVGCCKEMHIHLMGKYYLDEQEVSRDADEGQTVILPLGNQIDEDN